MTSFKPIANLKIIVVLFLILIIWHPGKSKPDTLPTSALVSFHQELEHLKQSLSIPGMAAGIIQNQKLVWSQGYGFSDIKKQSIPDKNTPWHIASVTKTFCAIIIMQLAEEGKLSLDDPLSKYGIFPDNRSPSIGKRDTVRIKHLLSHTSERKPGTFFRYSGALWGYFDQVVEQASGKSFRELLLERIIQPLQMTNTFPNRLSESEDYPYDSLRNNSATPYRLVRLNKVVEQDWELGFMTAGGLFSTVADMAIYDAVIDLDLLLSPKSKASMFTSFKSPKGRELEHALGWFRQEFGGEEIIWHFGWHPNHASSLYIKVPGQQLSFILMANTDKLSEPFCLHRGDVTLSPAALLFLKGIVFRERDIPGIEQLENRLKGTADKAGGHTPVMNGFEHLVYNVCLALFICALLFWPVRWLVLKVSPNLRKSNSSGGKALIWLPISIGYIHILLALFMFLVLARAPFLVYWPYPPGWMDGISPFENFALFLPTLLGFLWAVMILLNIGFIIQKKISVIYKTYLASVAGTSLVFLLLLVHWNLIGFRFYLLYTLS